MNRKTGDDEDQVLLVSFLNGDDESFSFIYNKYIDELFVYGIALGFEREILKDVIQDSFVKFYMNRKQLKGVVHLKYYLFRILKNGLIDLCKSSERKNIIGIPELSFSIEPSVLDELIALEDKIALETEIKDLLGVLTDRQREAVYLRYIQELEYEEVAVLLDMTEPAVRKLVSRAMKRMKNKDDE